MIVPINALVRFWKSLKIPSIPVPSAIKAVKNEKRNIKINNIKTIESSLLSGKNPKPNIDINEISTVANDKTKDRVP